MPSWATYNEHLDAVSSPDLPEEHRACQEAMDYGRTWGHLTPEEAAEAVFREADHPDLHKWMKWSLIKHANILSPHHRYWYIRTLIRSTPRRRLQPMLWVLRRKIWDHLTKREKDALREAAQTFRDNLDKPEGGAGG